MLSIEPCMEIVEIAAQGSMGLGSNVVFRPKGMGVEGPTGRDIWVEDFERQHETLIPDAGKGLFRINVDAALQGRGSERDFGIDGPGGQFDPRFGIRVPPLRRDLDRDRHDRALALRFSAIEDEREACGELPAWAFRKFLRPHCPITADDADTFIGVAIDKAAGLMPQRIPIVFSGGRTERVDRGFGELHTGVDGAGDTDCADYNGWYWHDVPLIIGSGHSTKIKQS